MQKIPPIVTNAPATSQPIPQSTSIDAKLVVLGAQGVGKTSLLTRFINPAATLSPNIQSTIGASFVTKRITDPDTSTTVRLQIWDTAGQERFRSISRLYYRGAHAGLLCYDVTDEKSWEEMKGWLKEMKENCDFEGDNAPIIHVVGTKSDIVAEDPFKRQVAFERTISYVAEQLGGTTTLAGSQASTPPLTLASKAGNILTTVTATAIPTASATTLQSPESKRSSVGFWNQDFGWDSCHEVNARDGEGIEEVFRVIARKLVDQRNRRDAAEAARLLQTPAGYRSEYGADDYFAGNHGHTGSFRLGDKRRSWLGLASVGLGAGTAPDADGSVSTAYATLDPEEARRRGRCC